MTKTGTTTTTTTTTTANTTCCPNCGSALPTPSSSSSSEPHAALLRAQRQIEDLQAQVVRLNEKAAAAVDRWADYEDELSRLRAASVTTASTSSTSNGGGAGAGAGAATTAPTTATSSPRSSFLPSASRLSQLLSPRRSLANLTGSASGGGGSSNSNHSNQSRQSQGQGNNNTLSPSLLSSPPRSQQQQRQQATKTTPAAAAVSTDELTSALTRERELRRAAEGKLDDTSREVEELSATLFEQANEMVAAERRARAALEERVGVLERRDAEKGDRLERLEGAVGRIERVRALLEDGGQR